MFSFLGILLTFVLVSFGGAQRHIWLAVEVVWLLAIAVMLVVRFVRRRSLDAPFTAFAVASGLIAVLMQPKLGVGLLCLGWACVAATNGEANTRRFFHYLLVVGFLEALLGLVQYFLVPGWIFGYQNTFYQSSGTFINHNHFAGLLEMLVPVTFGLAYSSLARFGDIARSYLYLLAGAFMGLALLFSSSRMGILSFLATIFFLATVLQLRKSRRRIEAALGFGLLGLVLAGALWVGVDGIVQRFSEVAGEEAILREGRVLVYRDALRMIAATPGGVGTGNFEYRFRKYQTFRPDLLFDHAHNDYLETAAEWGLPVAAAFWSLLIFAVIRAVRLFLSVESPEQRGILLACTGAIFSILLHGLTDFNLQIPANAMMFFTFVGISLAMPLRQEDTEDLKKVADKKHLRRSRKSFLNVSASVVSNK
jgi:O-antigen ligase